jgi:hypothetical protein
MEDIALCGRRGTPVGVRVVLRKCFTHYEELEVKQCPVRVVVVHIEEHRRLCCDSHQSRAAAYCQTTSA